MANNYDNAAWFYDSLSQLVFGKAIVNAQLYLLQYVSPRTNILIVGGGTGWILEELALLHPSGLKITYVEVSAKMMALSRKKNLGDNEVTFINFGIENVQLTMRFDVIITPFLFDNFKQITAERIFNQLHAALNIGGLWMYADFEPSGKWWHKPMVKTMHTFFKVLCGTEASKLPEVKQLFIAQGYTAQHSNAFFEELINATVYRRN